MAPDGGKASRASLPGLPVRETAPGDTVVDRNGTTVHRSLKDRAWPEPVSACSGACLEKRPAVAPVPASDTEVVRRKGLLGFTGPDGVRQTTVNRRPVHTFSGDRDGERDGAPERARRHATGRDAAPPHRTERAVRHVRSRTRASRTMPAHRRNPP
ncbi:hypothetical protein ACF061_23270 [Streptomyces sp. NPDC015220]|uniref:hypothetical protein n=1 Tax=Streptomyces sp. NPDC015220 TaxID=3364947 RepID=UPI0036F7BA75